MHMFPYRWISLIKFSVFKEATSKKVLFKLNFLYLEKFLYGKVYLKHCFLSFKMDLLKYHEQNFDDFKRLITQLDDIDNCKSCKSYKSLESSLAFPCVKYRVFFYLMHCLHLCKVGY